MIKQQVFIILRGGPATGKSTICKEIQKRMPEIIWLHVDSFKRFLNSGNENRDRDHWYGAAAASLDYFLAQNFSVIAEGIFQDHKYINLLLETAKKQNVRTKIYELLASGEVLIERDRKRKGVPEGIRPRLSKDIIKRLASQVNDNHFPEAEIINTEELTMTQIVDSILSYLQ